jgi:chemotaxis protein CheX
MNTTSADQTLGPVIEQIVENVFQTMMDLEVHPSDAPWPPRGDVITSSISLGGSWKGVVLLECAVPEALLFASRMIDVDPPSDVNDDVRDALGELANMVGGNLKSVLPGGVELSLPSVVWGSDYRVAICHAGGVQRWVFSSPEATFAVVVVEVGP